MIGGQLYEHPGMGSALAVDAWPINTFALSASFSFALQGRLHDWVLWATNPGKEQDKGQLF